MSNSDRTAPGSCACTPRGCRNRRSFPGVYGLHAAAYGISRDAFRSRMEDRTLCKRLPTIAEIADVAAFVASDRAAAITGAVANLTGGMIVD